MKEYWYLHYILLYILLSYSISTTAQAELSARPESTTQQLCQFLQKSEPERLAYLWSQQIYSAHIKVIDLKVPTTLTTKDVIQKTEQLKSKFQYTDANSARCGAEQVRLLLIDRKIPYTWDMGANTLKLDLKELKTTCNSSWLDYADLDGNPPVKLSLQETTHTQKYAPGIFALTCIKKDAVNAGPQLLYMFPHQVTATQLQQLHATFTKEMTKDSGVKSDSLHTWINSLRVKHKLPPLQLHPSLDTLSKALLDSDSVKHDRHQLQQLKDQLATHQSLAFLGENRVLGDSSADQALLLYLSPRHRSLILRQEARYLSIKRKKTSNNSFLAIMVVAR